jgi:type IV pilus assembly protein PilC
MKFLFKAKAANGEIREGRIDALSQDVAIAMIRDRGMLPLSIEAEKEVSFFKMDLQKMLEGVSLRELSVFFRQLATLVEAKVSIVASLQAVKDQSENSYLRSAIEGMCADIENGSSLSDAMGKYPDIFEGLMVSMVKAGELSGNLQRSVQFLASNTEKNYELNSRVKSAMFYPVFVLTFSCIIGFLVVSFVIPKLTSVFAGMNVTLPWYTQILMNIGGFMSQYWALVLVLVIAFFGGIIYYVKTEDGRREWDVFKMRLPLFGKLYEYIYISRFSENLAVLLDGGIPIVRSLIIVGEVVDSTTYEGVILRAADEVRSGGNMSNVFAKSEYFPPIVAQMIKIGEDSGKVSQVLRNVSDFYTKETERITRNLSTMLEPIMIIFLGAIVAVLVFSVFVPIYTMTSSIQ